MQIWNSHAVFPSTIFLKKVIFRKPYCPIHTPALPRKVDVIFTIAIFLIRINISIHYFLLQTPLSDDSFGNSRSIYLNYKFTSDRIKKSRDRPWFVTSLKLFILMNHYLYVHDTTDGSNLNCSMRSDALLWNLCFIEI